MTVHYSIDSLAARGDMIFGWGWILDESAAAERIELKVKSGAGTRVIPCIRAGQREDLALAFPTITHAAGAGFVFVGRLHPDEEGLVSLVADLADGSQIERDLPNFPRRYAPAESAQSSVATLARRALSHIRSRGLRSAWSSIWTRWCSGRLVSWWHWQTFRLGVGQKRPVVVFDHALGGGANRFRKEWVGGRVEAGGWVRVVTPVLSRLSYQVTDHVAGRDVVREYLDLQSLFAELDKQSVSDVVLNDLVSFDRPNVVTEWALDQKHKGGRVTFFLHDYFAACPSWTLIDDAGRYCNLPELDRCRQCLGRNSVPFLPLYDPVSIGSWRSDWARLLGSSDEIIAFSRASAEILCKAFPSLSPDQVQIRPHRTDYLPAEARARPTLGRPYVVAVIGHISEHKGAGILRSLVAEVRATAAPVRFKVFGSVENMSSSDVLDILGPYNAPDLPALLEAHQVGICLLPSICPETFSYVTSEIIHFGMPIAVFDLGAPAERARQYSLGCVLSSMEPGAVISELLRFGDTLAERQSTLSLPQNHITHRK